MKINYSPSAALNRVYALYKVTGAKAAITEAKKLSLDDNHFYFVLLGELYRNTDSEKTKRHFAKARTLAKTPPEKQIIQKKIDDLANTF